MILWNLETDFYVPNDYSFWGFVDYVLMDFLNVTVLAFQCLLLYYIWRFESHFG